MREQAKAFLAKKVAESNAKMTTLAKERDAWREKAQMADSAAESKSEAGADGPGDDAAAEIATLQERQLALEAHAEAMDGLRDQAEATSMQQQARAVRAETTLARAVKVHADELSRLAAERHAATEARDREAAEATELAVREAEARGAGAAREAAASALSGAKAAAAASESQLRAALGAMRSDLDASRAREAEGGRRLVAERAEAEILKRRLAAAEDDARAARAEADTARRAAREAAAAVGGGDESRRAAAAAVAEARASAAMDRKLYRDAEDALSRAEGRCRAAEEALSRAEAEAASSERRAETAERGASGAVEVAVREAVSLATARSQGRAEAAEREADEAKAAARAEARRSSSVRAELSALREAAEHGGTDAESAVSVLVEAVLPALQADGFRGPAPAPVAGGSAASRCLAAARRVEATVAAGRAEGAGRKMAVAAGGASAADGEGDGCLERLAAAVGFRRYARLGGARNAGDAAARGGAEP